MYELAVAALTGSALSALTLGFPAETLAAPSGIGSAQDTVNELEQDGYRVVLYKMGPAPLDRCTVDSVRPGEAVTQTVYLTARC
ncbi:hypothetical protein [Mycolicibacterium wolinskyi]|uniref:Uncharacterized protein n=1 Tax=Mycolicibacterium wolinskyi TaxID=59750 RepID=A0A132PTP9_9MYCO|nr:hypothetical protein [Mycolicibacterium wolinskyi]KWX25685.1 hypothetical protein AFM11_03975 [Mycolicibacterium wolinskyi]